MILWARGGEGKAVLKLCVKTDICADICEAEVLALDAAPRSMGCFKEANEAISRGMSEINAFKLQPGENGGDGGKPVQT